MARPRRVHLAFLYILSLAQTSYSQAINIERQSSEPDPSTSSGICYYANGEKADASYIPCGNTAYGNFHCCEASADCLDNNACYADGTTYVAGCTDPTYQDASCPNKGIYSNSQWSSLVYCNGTSDEWTLCPPTSSEQVVYVSGCYCPEDEGSRNFAFSAASSIPPQVSLPPGNGGAMSLFAGYTPGTVLTSTTSPPSSSTKSSSPPSSTPSTSSTPIASASSTSPSETSTLSTSTSSTSSSSASSSGTTNSGSAAITTSTSSQASSSSGSVGGTSKSTDTPTSGLSTGAKAGIGIGAALGGLIVLAALGCLAVWYRRRQRRSMLENDNLGSRAEVQPMGQNDFAPIPQRSPAWSTQKSELAGDQSTSASGLSPESVQQSWSRPLSEAEGSIPTYQSMASMRSQELSDTSVRQPYQPYRRAEVPPVGMQRYPHSSTGSQASYRPGRQVEGGVYEMPAQLPGSTLM